MHPVAARLSNDESGVYYGSSLGFRGFSPGCRASGRRERGKPTVGLPLSEEGDFHLVVEPRGGEKLVSRAPDCARHRIIEGDVQVLDCLDRASNVSRNDGEELGGVAGVGSLLLVGLEKAVWCLGFGICGVVHNRNAYAWRVVEISQSGRISHLLVDHGRDGGQFRSTTRSVLSNTSPLR